jgi:hypothetical protein
MTANRLRLALFAIALGALVPPAAAAAGADPKPPCQSSSSNPAIQQYTEALPTACGAQVSGAGHKVASLPRSVERKLHRHKNGKVLEQVATSSRYGAPASSSTSSTSSTAPKHKAATPPSGGQPAATHHRSATPTPARQTPPAAVTPSHETRTASTKPPATEHRERTALRKTRRKERPPVAEALGTLSGGSGSDDRLLALVIVMGVGTVLAFGAAAVRFVTLRQRR